MQNVIDRLSQEFPEKDICLLVCDTDGKTPARYITNIESEPLLVVLGALISHLERLVLSGIASF